MAIKSKTQLNSEIDSDMADGSGITAAVLRSKLHDIVDSYEDIIREYTTVQRDALTPFEGLKIYNTTSNRLEYYSASQWLPCSQKETVVLDASSNPNYPEALTGDQYIITVAGTVGGGSGKTVSVGDLVYCIADNAGGAEASVGTSWKVCYSGAASAQLKKATLTITSAQVLALNSTPLTIIPAVAGKAIQIVSGNMQAVFNTTAYTTNVALFVSAQSAALAMAGTNISFSASVFKPLEILYQTSGNEVQMVAGDAIQVYVYLGDPAAGDSDITITLLYIEL